MAELTRCAAWVDVHSNIERWSLWRPCAVLDGIHHTR
jgi:hypothetical protein